jgi:hypothetical protein
MLCKAQFPVTQRVQHHFTRGHAHVLARFHSFHGHVFDYFIWIDRLLHLVLFPRFGSSLPYLTACVGRH